MSTPLSVELNKPDSLLDLLELTSSDGLNGRVSVVETESGCYQETHQQDQRGPHSHVRFI